MRCDVLKEDDICSFVPLHVMLTLYMTDIMHKLTTKEYALKHKVAREMQCFYREEKTVSVIIGNKVKA